MTLTYRCRITVHQMANHPEGLIVQNRFYMPKQYISHKNPDLRLHPGSRAYTLLAPFPRRQ